MNSAEPEDKLKALYEEFVKVQDKIVALEARQRELEEEILKRLFPEAHRVASGNSVG